MIRIHNSETGEIIDREFTEEELKAKQERNNLINEELKKRQNELEAKQTAQNEARAKLTALGLTDDDLKALGL